MDLNCHHELLGLAVIRKDLVRQLWGKKPEVEWAGLESK
jgi:hypothetical protein